MSMTSEQREAAIEAMARRIAMTVDHDPTNDWVQYLDEARVNLTALTDAGFLLLHRDDVTEETQAMYEGRYAVPRTAPEGRPYRRLVTRWEPITKEDVGPWTTQETP